MNLTAETIARTAALASQGESGLALAQLCLSHGVNLQSADAAAGRARFTAVTAKQLRRMVTAVKAELTVWNAMLGTDVKVKRVLISDDELAVNGSRTVFDVLYKRAENTLALTACADFDHGSAADDRADSHVRAFEAHAVNEYREMLAS